jgi:Predicted permease
VSNVATVELISRIGDGFWNAFLMAWQVWWALVLGFFISAIVQSWVPRRRVEAALSGAGPRPVALATGLGAASSSCSYAAIAIAKSLFQKGASAASAERGPPESDLRLSFGRPTRRAWLQRRLRMVVGRTGRSIAVVAIREGCEVLGGEGCCVSGPELGPGCEDDCCSPDGWGTRARGPLARRQS